MIPGATGEIDTNYAGKDRRSHCLPGNRRTISSAIHIEAPDEATHNGRLDHKLLAIHQLDELVTKPARHLAAGKQGRLPPAGPLRPQDADAHPGPRWRPGPLLPLRQHRRAPLWPGLIRRSNGKAGPYLPAGTALMDLLFGKAITPVQNVRCPAPCCIGSVCADCPVPRAK